MTSTPLLLSVILAVGGAAVATPGDTLGPLRTIEGDTVPATALELRRADSLMTAECVQRVVERAGFQPWSEDEPTGTGVVGRLWVRPVDGTDKFDALRTRVIVRHDTVFALARFERARQDRTVNAAIGTVRQISNECPRPRTQLMRPATGR